MKGTRLARSCLFFVFAVTSIASGYVEDDDAYGPCGVDADDYATQQSVLLQERLEALNNQEPSTPGRVLAEALPRFKLGAILDFSKNKCGSTWAMAVIYALEHAKTRNGTFAPRLAQLEDFDFEVEYGNAAKSPPQAMRIAIEQMKARIVGTEPRTSPLAIIGPKCTCASKATSQFFQAFDVPQVSYGASSPDLSSRKTYPTFFRTVLTATGQAKTLGGLIHYLGFTDVFSIATDRPDGVDAQRTFSATAGKVFGVHIRERIFESNWDTPNAAAVRDILHQIRTNSLVRVIVTFVQDLDGLMLYKEAYEAGMIASGWAWFPDEKGLNILSGEQNNSYIPFFHGTLGVRGNDRSERLLPTGETAYDGFVKMWESEMPTKLVWQMHTAHMNDTNFDAVAGTYPLGGSRRKTVTCSSTSYSYDAAVAIILGISDAVKAARLAGKSPSDILSGDVLAAMRRFEPWEGLSGSVAFAADTNDRLGQFVIVNQNDKSSVSYTRIGKIDSAGNVSFDASMLVWPGGHRSKPSGRAVCPSGSFTGERSCVPCSAGTAQPAADQKYCRPCDAGTFTAADGAHSCERCSPGTYADSEGQVSCRACERGKYQSSSGSAEGCDSCPVGSHANAVGAISCVACGMAGTTTLYPGAVSEKQCLCREGTFDDTGPKCAVCKTGMHCDFGSAAQFGNVSSVVPRLRPGFYSSPSRPLSVFKCGNPQYCPGGMPGACAAGRGSQVCESCAEEGFGGDDCEPCDGSIKFAIAFVAVLVVVGCMAIYKFANDELSTHATVGLGISISFGLVVTCVQCLGTLAQLNLSWGEMTNPFFNFASVFTLSPSAFEMSCITKDPVASYLSLVTAPYVLVLVFGFLHVTSQVVPARAWKACYTCNSICHAIQSVAIAVAHIVSIPFQCYTHPNGKQSVIQFAMVLCHETSAHGVMVGAAIVLALTILAPFVALNLFGALFGPKWGSSRLVMFRFLFYRFRPDVWWWGIIFLMRQVLLAFTPAVMPDDPYAQIILVSVILAVYLGGSAAWWPWKSNELSLFDLVSGLFVMTIIIAAGATVETTQPGGYDILSFVMLGSLGVSVGALVLYSAWQAKTKGLRGEFTVASKCATLAADWQSLCKAVSELAPENCLQLLNELNSHDKWALQQTLTSLQEHGKFLSSCDTSPRIRSKGKHGIFNLSSDELDVEQVSTNAIVMNATVMV